MDQYRVHETNRTQVLFIRHSDIGVTPTTWMIDSQIIYALYSSRTIPVVATWSTGHS